MPCRRPGHPKFKASRPTPFPSLDALNKASRFKVSRPRCLK